MKKRLIKNIIMASLAFVMICTMKTTTKAATQNEAEPNDSMTEAELIEANLKEAQEYLDADNTRSHSVQGSTSSNDEDWFRVYLNQEKETYISFDRTDAVYFTVYDENGSIIHDRTLNTYGSEVYSSYYVDIPSDGYYYVRIEGLTETQESYSFLIGRPVYRWDSITLSNSPITLSSSNQTQTEYYNLESQDIKEQALVYNVSITGISLNTISKLTMEYSNSTHMITATTYASFSGFDIPLSYGYGADGSYKITYYYGIRSKTFTPAFTFRYIYPLLPEQTI